MKRERILKTLIVLINGVVLFAMTSNVFAADTGLDFFDDTPTQLDTNTNTNANTNAINTNTNATNTNNTNTVDTTNTSVATNTNTNNYNTNLPKAGAGENTIMGVAITVLAVVAIFAYKKVNQYKNI